MILATAKSELTHDSGGYVKCMLGATVPIRVSQDGLPLQVNWTGDRFVLLRQLGASAWWSDNVILVEKRPAQVAGLGIYPAIACYTYNQDDAERIAAVDQWDVEPSESHSPEEWFLNYISYGGVKLIKDEGSVRHRWAIRPTTLPGSVIEKRAGETRTTIEFVEKYRDQLARVLETIPVLCSSDFLCNEAWLRENSIVFDPELFDIVRL